MRSPLAALAYGLVAGAVGAGAQALFFKATRKWTPKPPPDAFEPPEERQKDEGETATVARRFVEGLMKRGPLSGDALERAGEIVHYSFGSLWGGAYGLWREGGTRRASPWAAAAFGAAVWAVSDNMILPAFRIAAGPLAYPWKTHLYALVAHVAYGAAVWSAYEALRADARLPRLAVRAVTGGHRTLPRLPRRFERALAELRA